MLHLCIPLFYLHKLGNAVRVCWTSNNLNPSIVAVNAPATVTREKDGFWREAFGGREGSSASGCDSSVSSQYMGPDLTLVRSRSRGRSVGN
jgi:hypothetical protein